MKQFNSVQVGVMAGLACVMVIGVTKAVAPTIECTSTNDLQIAQGFMMTWTASGEFRTVYIEHTLEMRDPYRVCHTTSSLGVR